MIKFIDLNKQYQRSKSGIDAAIQSVLDHGRYVMGPEITELESQLADFVGVKHCIATSNGTSALAVALMALNIQPGDEVITTPFSFFATAEVIVLLGATPIFVDIDPKTYNLDPSLLEAAITTKTKAILPVSLYGQPADFTSINAIAKRYELPVIEDGAQSFGARHYGQRSCGLSTVGCTSFFPSKPFGCYGDGGACFTNDDQINESMRMIINHGQKQRYVHERFGINGRLDTLQAAILLEKFTMFEDELSRRDQVAGWYQEALGDMAPYIAEYNDSVYGVYTVQVADRDDCIDALNAHQIPTAVHYPIGLHEQPAIRQREGGSPGHFPHTEAAAKRVLGLPFHPFMTQHEVKQVADCLLAIATETA